SSPALAWEMTRSGESGITAQAANAERDHRRHPKDQLVGVRRDDHFLGQELENVGERLPQPREEAENAHPVGSAAQLHPSDDLALPQRQERDTKDEHERDDHDPNRRPGDARERRPGSGKSLQHDQYVTAGVRPSRVFCREGARRTNASIWYIGMSTTLCAGWTLAPCPIACLPEYAGAEYAVGVPTSVANSLRTSSDDW